MYKRSNGELRRESLLPRREFVKRGASFALGLGAAVVGSHNALAEAPPNTGNRLAASGPAVAAPIDGIGAAAVASAFALGYWPLGSVNAPAIDPASLATGDGSLEQMGASLLIYGSTAALAGLGGKSLALSVNFFPQQMSGQSIAAVAWAQGSAEIATEVSTSTLTGGNRMQIPVDSTRASLSLTAEFSGAPAAIVLSTRNQVGAAKLRVGTYIIAAPSVTTCNLPNLTQWAWIFGDGKSQLGKLVPAVASDSPGPSAPPAAAEAAGGLISPASLSMPDFPFLVVEVSYGTLSQ